MTPGGVPGGSQAFRSLEELTAAQVAERLDLQPHKEGGFFRETYRSPFWVLTEAGPRVASTAILYLLTVENPSRFHRLRFDELWAYHAGAPAEMVLLAPRETAGSDSATGGESDRSATLSAATPGGADSSRAVTGTKTGAEPTAGRPSAGEPVTRQLIGLDNPQLLVPGGHWLASRVVSEDQADWGEGWAPERRWTADRRANPEARWTLVSCVVTPGFEYGDFELADREILLASYPQARRVIQDLT